MKLTTKHFAFIEAYDGGNEAEAMQVAGFSGTPASLTSRARQLLADPTVLEAIRQRGLYTQQVQNARATREERQALWSSIMRNEDPHERPELDGNGIPLPAQPTNIPLALRLKASELLGKSEADFSENINLQGNVTITDLITQSYSKDVPLEVIEAEYNLLKQQSKSLEDFI